VFLVKRKKTFMRFTDSNPILGMDNGTSNSEALFSAPQCLAQRFDHVAHFIEYLNESVVCAAEKLCAADCIAGKTLDHE
jgi:hypothetical protein